MANNVYAFIEKNDHLYLKNNTGAAIDQFQLIVLMGLVAIADGDVEIDGEGGFHVEDGLLVRANVNDTSGDGVVSENTFATLGQSVYLTPDGLFSDVETAGYYKIGTLSVVKASDSHITFMKDKYATLIEAATREEFSAYGSFVSADSATPISLLTDEEVGTGRQVHITGMTLVVDGAVAWSGGTGSTVIIQDTADVAGVTFAVADLKASTSLNLTGATLADGVKLGTGLTAGKGIEIAADAAFTTGSTIKVMVNGYLL